MHDKNRDGSPAAPRPRGRPPAEIKKVPITTWVTPGEYERIRRFGKVQDESISSIVRSLLILRLPSKK